MNTSQAQKRAEKAQHLPVIQVEEGQFYVQSEEGKIAYLVSLNGGIACSCANFVKNARTDPEYQCKHVMAVLDTEAGERFQTSFLDRRKPTLSPEFVKAIDGKEFVTYQGLLDLAHQRSLIRISTQVLQYPLPDNGNTAVVQAVAETKTGEMFSDVGDANPNNCNSKVARHIIRMASTRAKARALRDMTNVGMTALEELGEVDDILPGSGKKDTSTGTRTTRGRKSAKVTPMAKHQDEQDQHQGVSGSEESGPSDKAQNQTPHQDQNQAQAVDQPQDRPKMSEAQKRAIANLSRRRNISEAEVQKMAMDAYGVELEHLCSSDAAAFIRQLQQSA